MASTPRRYVVGGREVPLSDVVLRLTVTSTFEGCDSFVHANRSRLHQAPATIRLDRRERSPTQDRAVSYYLILSFSNPPGQSRSQFVIGRYAGSCDIVCSSRMVSNQHIKFAVEGDDVVMYDVSSRGSGLALDGRGTQWTCPKPGTPYRCILPRAAQITLTLEGSMEFQIDVPYFKAAELSEFRKKRDAFLANCSDIGALNIASQVPTKPATPSRVGRQYMYWFGPVLGNGGCGMVHKVHRLQDWAVFAAKQVLEREPDSGQPGSNPTPGSEVESDLDTETRVKVRAKRKKLEDQRRRVEAERRRLKREMKTLQALRHERIVQYVDWYEDVQDSWILVMEYCQYGSLQHMITTASAPFPVQEVAEILKQAAEGLQYLHSQGTTHRDLKPHNILVRSRNPLSLALCDFGLAKRKVDDDSYMETACGTLSYMAPEIWMDGLYTRAVDIWALGVIGFQLLLRGLPRLPKERQREYPKVIFDKAAAMQEKDPRNRNPLIGNVRKMLAWDPRDRPPPDECIRDADDVLDPPPSTLPPQALVPGGGPAVAVQLPTESSSLGSSEIRSLEKYFQTSGALNADAAAKVSPKSDRPDARSKSSREQDATIAARKRDTNALPRSNSMEAPASKLPRTEEQRPPHHKDANAPPPLSAEGTGSRPPRPSMGTNAGSRSSSPLNATPSTARRAEENARRVTRASAQAQRSGVGSPLRPTDANAFAAAGGRHPSKERASPCDSPARTNSPTPPRQSPVQKSGSGADVLPQSCSTQSFINHTLAEH